MVGETVDEYLYFIYKQSGMTDKEIIDKLGLPRESPSSNKITKYLAIIPLLLIGYGILDYAYLKDRRYERSVLEHNIISALDVNRNSKISSEEFKIFSEYMKKHKLSYNQSHESVEELTLGELRSYWWRGGPILWKGK